MNDSERLDEALYFLYGEQGSGAVKRMLYAVYVGVVMAATYGFTVLRAVFDTSDPAWMQEVLASPITWLAAAGVVVTLGVLVHRAGRIRGPIVAPLPWLDVVGVSSIDRARSLRQWWTFGVVGMVAGGVIAGATIGGGVWAGHAGGPLWLILGVPIGAAIGWLLMVLWLDGQTSMDEKVLTRRRAGQGWKPLRLMGIEELRRQSTRSEHIGGGVLAGDLRAVRLEVASPVTRGRNLRLRSAGPIRTMIRRDVLGLRRQPGSAVTGLLLSAVGGGLVGWVLVEPRVPLVVACLAMIPAYFGFGAWAEGVRLQGDNAGTPPLIGLLFRDEALSHLVSPVTLFVVVGGLAASGAAWLVAGTLSWVVVGSVVGWVVLLTVLLAGMTLAAAFRGQPPMSAFRSGSGPYGMLGWLAIPLGYTILAGGLPTAFAGQRGIQSLLFVMVVAALAAVWWGLTRMRKQELAHRE